MTETVVNIAPEMPPWSVIPFVGLLLSIAILPLCAARWWHSNWNKAMVAVFFGFPVGAAMLFHVPSEAGHAALEYLAFICMIGALFTIAGGIRIGGSLAGTPLANTGLLAAGALLGNLIGTTGAAMLLIRPLLRANRFRRSKSHLVVFFIFIVANCGGCLTPLGDPPLFLGFLNGVPFEWTLRLWREWLFTTGSLLVLFNLLDQYCFHREDLKARQDLDVVAEQHKPFTVEGYSNIALLGGAVAIVLAAGFWIHPRYGDTASKILQSLFLAILAAISIWITPKQLRKGNDFSWHPLVEVVVLFAGIFSAMIPALILLRTEGVSLGIVAPWQYFWATGVLSSFLDNAPTYLAFLSLSQHLPDEVAGTTHVTLRAIAAGAVFFGAMTYIGNGPNFMVRAIAEDAGVRMPTFFGYMAWSTAILLPIFGLVTVLFLGI